MNMKTENISINKRINEKKLKTSTTTRKCLLEILQFI